MPLDRAPQLAGKARVHIVALGDVGTTMLIGLLLAGQVLSACAISTRRTWPAWKWR